MERDKGEKYEDAGNKKPEEEEDDDDDGRQTERRERKGNEIGMSRWPGKKETVTACKAERHAARTGIPRPSLQHSSILLFSLLHASARALPYSWVLASGMPVAGRRTSPRDRVCGEPTDPGIYRQKRKEPLSIEAAGR